MISKNKYKEEDNPCKKDELFYQRIQKFSRMSFIVFYTSFNNEHQQQSEKENETDSSVNLCIASCQQPKRVHNTKTEKETKTEQ